MPELNHLAALRAALARAEKAARRDPLLRPAVDEARSAYQAAKLEDYVTRVVAQVPPLSDQRKDRIAALLRPIPAVGGGSDVTS